MGGWLLRPSLIVPKQRAGPAQARSHLAREDEEELVCRLAHAADVLAVVEDVDTGGRGELRVLLGLQAT